MPGHQILTTINIRSEYRYYNQVSFISRLFFVSLLSLFMRVYTGP